MSTDDNPSNRQQPPSEGTGPEATPPGAGGVPGASAGAASGPRPQGAAPGGPGAGFLPAPTPADTDAPVAVVTSGVADDDDDVLEPTQIMPPVAARPQAGGYGQLGPAPGPHNPDQPWGPGAPGDGGYPIPGPPPYGRPPGPGQPGYGQPGPAGAPPYPPGGGMGTPGGPNRRRLLLAGGMVAALVVVGAGSFFGVRALTSGPDSAGPPTAGRTPSAGVSSPAPSRSVPPNGGIDSVRTDAKTMTVAEAFPAKSVTADGATFTQVRATVLEGCKDAAKGGLAKALRAAGCERVVDATYVDTDKKYAVTAGIAALPSKEDAARANKAADSRKGDWFVPLAAKKGTGADKIDKAGGYAASLAWGRYIVFSYATHSDGHTPSGKDKHLAELSQSFRETATKAIITRASS